MANSTPLSDNPIGDETPRKPIVLVVEDNVSNFVLIARMLGFMGIQCEWKSSGYDVVEFADALPYLDLILMDIQLPEVSGLEVTKWIKEDDELKTIPVIAVTAFAMKGDEERIRQGGCEDYLSKPISVTKFIDTIKLYLGDN